MKNYYKEDEIEEAQQLNREKMAKLSLKYPIIEKAQQPVDIIKFKIKEIKNFIASFSQRMIFEELQGKTFTTVELIEPDSFWNNNDDFIGQVIKFSINKNEFYLLNISDGFSFLDFYSISDKSSKKIEELHESLNKLQNFQK